MTSLWRLIYSKEAIRNLKSLDHQSSRRLLDYMTERVMSLDDPRRLGKALKGSQWGDCWRYRCGDYRIIVHLIDRDLVVMVLRTGHRKDVY